MIVTDEAGERYVSMPEVEFWIYAWLLLVAGGFITAVCIANGLGLYGLLGLFLLGPASLAILLAVCWIYETWIFPRQLRREYRRMVSVVGDLLQDSFSQEELTALGERTFRDARAEGSWDLIPGFEKYWRTFINMLEERAWVGSKVNNRVKLFAWDLTLGWLRKSFQEKPIESSPLHPGQHP